MEQITKENVLQVLFSAYPPFKERFDENRDLYYSDGEPLLYLVASNIADEIIELSNRNDSTSLKKIFDFIETLYERGDDYIIELAAVGFLEDIQNNSGWTETNPLEKVVSYLRPQSERSWDQVHDFWSGETPLIGVSWEELAKAKLEERGITAPSELQLKREIVKQMERQQRTMRGNNLTGLKGVAIILIAIAGLIIFLLIFALLLPQ